MQAQVSLNFLSPEKKALLRKGFIFAYAQNMLFVFFLVVAFCSGMLIALRMMLADTLRDIDTQTNGNDRDTKAVIDEIASVNAYLTRQESYMKGFTVWSTVLSELTDAAPQGVQYQTLSINDAGNVSLKGKAQERSAVLALEAKLKASPNFKDVQAPLSNILQQYNVDFTFTMNMTNPPQIPKPQEAPKGRNRNR